MEHGSTFILAGISGLWIVLTDPQTKPEQVIVVRSSTLTPPPDPCWLDNCDHEEIASHCWLDLASPQITSADTLNGLCQSGQVSLKACCDPSVLHRILLHAGRSRFFPNHLKSVLITF
jgi:hypothetical protein